MTQDSTEIGEGGRREPRRTGTRRPEARRQRYLLLPPTMSVKELAERSGINPIDVIKQLMRNGIMASMNNVIDFDVALLVTSAFNIRGGGGGGGGGPTGGSGRRHGTGFFRWPTQRTRPSWNPGRRW